MTCEELLFALDIGTRTVIGLVLKPTADGLEIIASKVCEHESRSMLDGQIHNVIQVAKVVQEIKAGLEEEIGQQLTRVAVAAAGRALLTSKETHQLDFTTRREITPEDVTMLELAAVQKAQKKLAQEQADQPTDYHFVGYSVVGYRLDEMHIGNLIGQKGKKLAVDIIATFLPQIVVDSLISVIQHADLSVQHMTLEPIAAANVVIPKEMHNFNLALVDIGAGTSDIAITRGGAIMAYAMVPVAGDEITEALAEHYLLDYKTGERLKRLLAEEKTVTVTDILSSTIDIETREALLVLKEPVEELANLISKEIIELNGKSPQAVLCIGGGSLTPMLTEKLAAKLDLPPNRVGMKKAIDITTVQGEVTGLASTQTVTPIGIAVTSWANSNTATFIDIWLNDERLSIFSLGSPNVSDAFLASNITVKGLNGRPGMALTCKVNGQLKTLKGSMGKPGHLEVNGEPANLDTPIQDGDKIKYKPGKDGQDGSGLIEDVVELGQARTLIFNGNPTRLQPQVFMNGKLVDLKTPIEDRAQVRTTSIETYREALMHLLEVPAAELISREITYTINGQKQTLQQGKYSVQVNGKYVDLDLPLTDGDKIEVQPLSDGVLTIEEGVHRAGLNMELCVTFNARELIVPTNNWEISKNGEPVTIDEPIQNGDEIICRPRPVSFNRILSFINYQISDTMTGKLVMTVNGEPAKFTDPVQSGDVLEIRLSD